MKKKIASLTLVLALMFSLSVPAFAAARWGDTATCAVTLRFRGSTANCEANINGKSGTNKITASVSLEQKTSNGTYAQVESWSETSYGQSWSFSETVSGCASGYYRLAVNATVYNSDGSSSPAGETIYANF